MMERVQFIQTNLNFIRNEISNLSGKCRLVAVSKTKPVEDIQAAYQVGHRHFGENYVQELVEKAKVLPSDINWHFIGSVQSNKLKLLASVPNLFALETLESIKKAKALDKACANRIPPLKIFIQINTSKEESKSGVTVEECISVAKSILDGCKNLEIAGLMTIGSPGSSQLDINPDFEVLKDCKVRIESALGLKDLELSMGMSDDYLIAVKQGSTNVRVGSGIFGQRETNKN